MATQPGLLPDRQPMGRAGLEAVLLVLFLHLRRIDPYLAAAGYGVAGSAVPVAICLQGAIATRLAVAGTLHRNRRLSRRNPLGIVSRHGRPTAVPAALISCRPSSRSYDQAPLRHSPDRKSTRLNSSHLGIS